MYSNDNRTVVSLREVAAADFAALEMRLFCDTHPRDERAKALMFEYQRKAAMLKEQYQSQCALLIADDNYKFPNRNWLREPWPWQEA